MRLVLIVSPFSGNRELHDTYLKRAMLDALDREEVPIASHALYPAILDDDDPEERALGMKLGHELMRRVDLVAVYADLGWSAEMKVDHAAAQDLRVPIEVRYLDAHSRAR